MYLLKRLYEKVYKKPAPYYYDYSLTKILMKPLRKWLTVAVAPYCPFNCVRIAIYRLCGFKIGKRTFIGMRCYLDDMCYDLLTIGDDVTISYGVYFACHGRKQRHFPIVVSDGAYVGMRACVISKNNDAQSEGTVIGRSAIIGACALVNKSVPDGATAVGIPCRIIESKSASPESARERREGKETQ